jgi:predicted nuclease with TOPRIM domain
VNPSRQTTSNPGSLRLLPSKSLNHKIIVIENEKFRLKNYYDQLFDKYNRLIVDHNRLNDDHKNLIGNFYSLMTDYHNLQGINENVRERLKKAEKTIKEFAANIKMQTLAPVTRRKDKKILIGK